MAAHTPWMAATPSGAPAQLCVATSGGKQRHVTPTGLLDFGGVFATPLDEDGDTDDTPRSDEGPGGAWSPGGEVRRRRPATPSCHCVCLGPLTRRSV